MQTRSPSDGRGVIHGTVQHLNPPSLRPEARDRHEGGGHQRARHTRGRGPAPHADQDLRRTAFDSPVRGEDVARWVRRIQGRVVHLDLESDEKRSVAACAVVTCSRSPDGTRSQESKCCLALESSITKPRAGSLGRLASTLEAAADIGLDPRPRGALTPLGREE